MTTLVIEGLTSDDKVPGAYGETKYGQGKMSVGAAAKKVLLLGYKLAAGSATADQDIDRIIGMAEAEALYGAKSMICNMARASFESVGEGGVELYGAPTAVSGGVAATLTIQVSGTWSTAGSFTIKVGLNSYLIAVAATDTIEIVATRIAAALNAYKYQQFTAVVGAGATYIVTCTFDTVGIHGNQLYVSKADASRPSGMTIALAGGTPVSGSLVPFGATPGSGVPTLTTLLALMTSTQYDFIVCGFNDAASLAAIEAHVDSMALATVGSLQHVISATNALLATATSLSQTTVNAFRCGLMWDEFNEALPYEMAAEFGAIRGSREGSNPWQNYNGQKLKTAAPKGYGPNIATHAELKTALNVGLTPVTTVNGECRIVRAIVSHCLTGTSPDYTCYDLPDAAVPDRVRQEVVALWTAHAQANPGVQDNPAEGENVRSGVTYPDLWNAELVQAVYDFQKNGWLWDIGNNLPTSEWDDDTNRIMSAVPCKVVPINAQLGFSVRQIAS